MVNNNSGRYGDDAAFAREPIRHQSCLSMKTENRILNNICMLDHKTSFFQYYDKHCNVQIERVDL